MDAVEVKRQADIAFAQLRAKIMSAFQQEFAANPDLSQGGQLQINFQIAYMAALIDVAAVIGVDAGITNEMFLGVADENYKGAYARAPKFG